VSRSVRVSLLVLSTFLATGCLRKGPSAGAQTPEAAKPPEPEFLKPAENGLLDVEPTDTPSAVFLDDGKPFCFSGSNNYYLQFKQREMVDDVLLQAKAMNLKVMRTWGFIDRGALDGSVANVDGEGHKEDVYFQYWDTQAKKPAYNDGENGLVRLDYTLSKAKEVGVRILVVLTNNWKEFGGMNQYLEWFGLKYHHEFYTDARAKQAYKNWVSHLVNRVNTITKVPYKDDPTIFAWELANEPRCRNFGKYDRLQDCNTETVTNWAKEMSAYIKSIDSNHMVAVGDEGFFKRAGGSGEQYTGKDGVDHDALLAIPSVDFGTFHLYPEHWSVGSRWGNTWVEDHVKAAQAAGKPTVLEEYGIKLTRNDKGEVTNGFDRRSTAYTNWNNLMLKRGGNASMFWILVGKDPHSDIGVYKDYDHFSVYNTSNDESAKLLTKYANDFVNARACELANAQGVSGKPSPFVSAVGPLKKVAALDARASRALAQSWLQ
jgi:mannan endo-1,4-beta-mannosidase